MVGVGVGCRRGAHAVARRPECSEWSVAHADDVRQWFRMTYRSAAFSAAACALRAQAAAENTAFRSWQRVTALTYHQPKP